jgi:hypothetical protein
VIAAPTHSLESLKARRLSAPLIAVAMEMTDCLFEAADDVAGDTRDEAFDDSTSRGSLLYRRARNRMLARFVDRHEVVCDTTDNALHIRVNGTAISFYSARDGLDSPNVSGSRTKQVVVDESQTMFAFDDRLEIRRLVLMHEASPDGLVRAAIGKLESATKWSWRVTLFDRFAVSDSPEAAGQGASYMEQPEVELPPLVRRENLNADDSMNR